MPGVRVAALLAAGLLLLASQGVAASPLVEVEDLKQRVEPGSPTTYADLLKLIFPETPPGEKKELQTPLVRNIRGDFKKQHLTMRQDQDYGVVQAQPIKAQGRPFLLLLVHAIGEPAIGEEDEEEGDAGEQDYNLLALFQTTPAPKLLDLVDIRERFPARLDGFRRQNPNNPLLDLSPGTQACVIFQEHFNSGESFLQIYLLWVRNQRLEKILVVSPYSVKAPPPYKTFATGTVFWTEPDKGRKFPKVVAQLTLKMEPTPKIEDADKPRQRGFTREYRGVWRWDQAKQKYGQIGGNLGHLYKFYKNN